MARAAVAVAFLLAGAVAAEDAASCPDGVCQADGEEAALLQKVAQKHAHGAAEPTCTTTPAATCGNPDIMCFLDTAGCPGACCAAAGPNAPQACRFCGTGDPCPACPGMPSPTSGPTPAPTTPAPTVNYDCDNQPGYIQQGGKCMAQSDGYWYGCCASGLECKAPANSAPGTYKRCVSPTSPTPSPTIDYDCNSPGQIQQNNKCMAEPDGYWYGCCAAGLECTAPANSAPGAYKVCTKVDYSCSQWGQVGLGQKCMFEPDGYWYGCCKYPLYCEKSSNAPGAYKVCMQPRPVPGR